MLRKAIAASLVFVLGIGVVFAEEFQAVITKVDGNKITFHKVKGFGKDAEKGDEMTLPAAKGVKVLKAKFNRETKKVEAGDALEEGLKNKAFTDIPEGKGRRVTIITDSDNKRITEIRVFAGRGKGKGKGKDKQ